MPLGRESLKLPIEIGIRDFAPDRMLVNSVLITEQVLKFGQSAIEFARKTGMNTAQQFMKGYAENNALSALEQRKAEHLDVETQLRYIDLPAQEEFESELQRTQRPIEADQR